MFSQKYIQLGRKIRYYRAVKEMGQMELALHIGITPQYLSKLEHGSARPSMDLLFTIANALEIDVIKLLETAED